MAFHYSPKIVTDGLVLALDAANRKSYPGSGTVWKDLSGNNTNGTLVNGPTFDGGNAGSIDFDGTNDYISFPSNIFSTLTSITISFWFYWTNNEQWTRIFDFGASTSVYMFLTPRSSANTPRFVIRPVGGSEQVINAPSAISTNVWSNIVITLNGTTGIMYMNGASIQSNSISSTPDDLGNTGNNWIGKSQFSDPYYTGNISNVTIYNKALSATEVLQNYNATKTRFI